jgi:hypothetical protein
MVSPGPKQLPGGLELTGYNPPPQTEQQHLGSSSLVRSRDREPANFSDELTRLSRFDLRQWGSGQTLWLQGSVKKQWLGETGGSFSRALLKEKEA